MEKVVTMSMPDLSYNSVSHSNDNRLFPPLWHTRYQHLIELRENIKRIIQEEVASDNKKILADMGCGEMPYASLLAPHVRELYAVDLPGNPKATHFVDLETNRTNIEAGTVDIVWSVMVLEHVAEPDKYLAECRRILKPGGKLILCTHGHWMFHPDPIDYWRWTSQGLRVEVERSGFQVTKFWGMMGLLSMSIQLVQDAVLLHLPFTKYWAKPYAFVMQRFISMATWFENKSKTTKAYKDKDACVFFVIASRLTSIKGI